MLQNNVDKQRPSITHLQILIILVGLTMSRIISALVTTPISSSRQLRSSLHMTYYYSTSSMALNASSSSPLYQSPSKLIDVPLVFVPGMKGTHLAFHDDDAKSTTKKKKRAWLTLGNLLNLPPRPDNDPDRDLSLPLTYDYHPPMEGEDGYEYAKHYPRQHRGKLIPNGIVDHIIELNVGSAEQPNYAATNFLPFYGHAVSLLSCMCIYTNVAPLNYAYLTLYLI